MSDINSAQRTEIYLKEFESLRQEIDNRTQLGTYLLLAEVTVLGAGLSIVSQLPEVLPGMALITSYLLLPWLDQTEQIYKISAYIGLRLSPRLQTVAQDALGWEMFLRQLDRGGTGATKALHPNGLPSDAISSVHITPSINITKYVIAVFGMLPILMLIAYASITSGYAYTGGIALWGRITGVILSLIIWIFSMFRWLQFSKSVKAIESAFSHYLQTSIMTSSRQDSISRSRSNH